MGSNEIPNLVVKSQVFNLINTHQIINKDTKEIIFKDVAEFNSQNEYLLENLLITPEAKEILIEKINKYIIQQILLLKEKMPRKLRGKNKHELIKKTIDEKNEILKNEFPQITIFTLTDVKKKIQKVF